MKLVIANSVGVDGELTIREVTAYNSRNNSSVSLTGSVINKPINVPGPKLPNVGQTISSGVELNSQNSNIKDLLNLLPDSLYFDLQVLANHKANKNQHDNFATGDSKISAIMDLEIPLHGMADNLTLETESGLDIAGAGLNEDVKDGSLNLIVENFFPFESAIQVYFYDNDKVIMDSLFHSGDQNVISAGLPGPDGIVVTPAKATLGSFFDENRLDQLKMKSTSAKVKFRLSTKPAGQNIKLYSNYRIDFRLVGDFKYHVGG